MADQSEAQRHLEAGNYFLDQGRHFKEARYFEEACVEYQKATEYKHDYAEAYNNWGVALGYLKEYDEAIKKYQKAIEYKHDYADAYYNWGIALRNLKEYDEAIKKYQKAIEYKHDYADAYYNWGVALEYLKRYDEEIERYQKAIQFDADGITAVYAYNNIANLLWRLREYKASWREWEKARVAYEKTKQKARDSNDADYFLYFGSVLDEIFCEFKTAKTIYTEGLELDPNHVDILIRLVKLYLVIMDEYVNEPARTYWMSQAQEEYKKAKGILEDKLKWEKDAETCFKLGDLYLAMEEYGKAEEKLQSAIEKGVDSPMPYSDLGILYTYQEDYKKAVQYFKEAYNKDQKDLTVQSNLAEAYLKAEKADMAEIEYKKILRITPYHVESHIGLGEVYTDMAADEDEDLYDKAIYHFTEGINIATRKKGKIGSKILKKKELAAALYSRGYARVKLFETSKIMKDENLLQDALKDFKKCFRNYPDNHKAKRAIEKIEKRTKYFSPQKLTEKLGPWSIFFSSLFVFVLSQFSYIISYLAGEPIFIGVNYYVLLTFSSLIFMVVGLYLPQILKLKVGGIELEKSPVEQITTPTTLGISK